jgi:uncharacterized cupin superfamily protein
MAKVIIENLGPEEIEKRRIKSWPVWEKEISRFDWTYDGDEECYILEGEVDVETPEDGLNCIWDIKKNIRKHYRFK